MRSALEQLMGLQALAKYITKWEVNLGIQPAGADVAILQMVDTPRGSQVIYADNSYRGYDIWAWSPTGHRLQASNISLEDAAKIMVAEYFTAKIARIKTHRPDADVGDLLRRLEQGYQKGLPAILVVAPAKQRN